MASMLLRYECADSDQAGMSLSKYYASQECQPKHRSITIYMPKQRPMCWKGAGQR
jgi:hypothetical protein